MAESQVEKLMRILQITEEEALEVIASDKAVDKMRDSQVDSDLSADQKAAAKKARQADRKLLVLDMKKRERKKNATKQGIIDEIFNFLKENCGFNAENITIVNAERQIDFIVGENSFSITLTQHRKPKK